MSRDWETCSTNHENGVKTKLSTDVYQAKLEARVGQKLTGLTLHNGMRLLRWNSSNHKIVKYREMNLNPSD